MFKKLLLLLILGIALTAPAGEKRIIGSKAGGTQTLMRVDIVSRIIEYTVNGVDWFQPLLAEATTSSAGLLSASDKSKINLIPASLGTAGQVWTVNGLATAAEWVTPTSGVDLSAYGSTYNGHYARFAYSSGGIDENTRHLFHFDNATTDDVGTETFEWTNSVSTYGTGKFSNAITVSVGSRLGWYLDPAKDIFSISTPMTWDFWIKPTSVVADGNSYDNLISQFQDSYWSWLYFHLTSDYKLQVWYNYRNGTYESYTTPVQLTQGAWQHVAIVHEGGGLVKVYVNGTLQTSHTFTYFELGNNSGGFGDGECFVIAGRKLGDSFGGSLDEYSISHGVARWTADFTPPAAPYSAEATRAIYIDSTALSNATASNAGLMSSADKAKLDGLESTTPWDSITGKPAVLAQYNGTVDDNGVITLENSVAVADIALGSVVKFTAANTAQGVAAGDLYQKKLQSITPDPVEYDDAVLIVSGAGKTELNGTYVLDPSYGTGTDRRWIKNDSSGCYIYTPNGRWWIRAPEYYGYYTTSYSDSDPWLGEWNIDVGGEAPIPTVTRGILGTATDRLAQFAPIGQDATTSKAGFMSASDKSKLDELATVATSGSYSDLSGTPSLAAVATSGSYADLTNKPSEATTSAAGLMSSSDKTKIDALFTSVTINAQTESYTLVLADKSKLITMSNASANTLTIPLNSSVAYAVGTWIDIVNIGAGTCTITATSGVTLNGVDGGTKDLAQWAGVRLYKIAENTWITR